MSSSVVAFECPECSKPRTDHETVCPSCGAPPLEKRDETDAERAVRTNDLEPYIALRYIARLFKVLAVLMVLMMIGEVVVGIMTEGRAAMVTLVAEATRLLVIGGFLWAAGDLAVLLIDMGHDIRVVRILLGRVNAEVHRRSREETSKE